MEASIVEALAEVCLQAIQKIPEISMAPEKYMILKLFARRAEPFPKLSEFLGKVKVEATSVRERWSV